jgi:AcrR family transcriptional regulator
VDLAETAQGDSENVSSRRVRILDGARAAFLRFGFERTTLADIAVGAGVSRSALYHYFPGKEDVLEAVVEEFHAGILKAAGRALEESRTLEEALSRLLEEKFGRTLSLMAESPHFLELIQATHRLTGPANRAADEAFHVLIVKALSRHGRTERADAVADTLIAAAKGLMQSGEVHVSKEKFAQRLRLLIGWVISQRFDVSDP